MDTIPIISNTDLCGVNVAFEVRDIDKIRILGCTNIDIEYHDKKNNTYIVTCTLPKGITKSKLNNDDNILYYTLPKFKQLPRLL
ncbi:Hypothetical protein ORPV_572 [Orpheovirus IHUMI-LCC2]|uniref:Uncharacterized protein n=1 Tax=Orpheovirus IHUMI-LCC2 TaxID=2023057 RepID=A0A2I2L4M0_9VIRU|nr:Hypothetical protein ORPV_572 [Orpheovirus IHUMI-LCC2]SNW62476.1 Hypothetical protein ORPV_572 [Orpheovirus IHUMI-LCC2]